MIICLKDISEKFFSFNVMAIPAGHSDTWAQKGYLGTQRTLGHMGTRRGVEEKSGT